MHAYRLLFDDLMRRLGWRFPALIGWTALVGISESASVVLLLPLLERLGLASGSQGFAAGAVDKVLAFAGADGTAKIFALILAVGTVQLVLSLALNWWSVRLARDYQARRQLELFSAFMRAKWLFVIGLKAGEMTSAIVTESERLGRAFTISLALLASAVIAFVYLLLSVLVAWQVTLGLVGFAALAAAGMGRLYRKSYTLGAKLAPLNAQLQSLLDEHFAAAKFVKASIGAERACAQIAPLVHKIGDANAYASAMPIAVRAVLEYLALAMLAAVLAVAAGGAISGADVVIVLALFARLFPRITAVQAQLHYLNANVHAIEAINALQEAAEAQAERRDGARAAFESGRPATLAVRGLKVRLGERALLDDVTLTLPIPGLLAIVGRSGAGKSTLVHALLGLVEADEGSIMLGEHALAATSLTAWRGAIGYVPQETVLFHASIRDNLTIINPAASEAEIERAARRAQAYDFIMACEQGFDTIIGDQGLKLSGGERQRLGIARALLARPILLIMDEPMSALDAQSEAALLNTIGDLRREMGVVMVVHRLASVRDADCVCVLEDGRVAEAGTWDELMARRARLHALVQAQDLDAPLAPAAGWSSFGNRE
jgi:ATP-binding cassette subfamily C protein